MPGPAPKPAAQRRRRNKPVVQDTVLDPVPDDVEIPDMPGQLAKNAHEFTQKWWDAIWRSPMAAKFQALDELVIVRMAILVNKCAQGRAKGQELSELRQLEDRFGLSPLARRRLGWEITEPKAQKQAENADNVVDIGSWQDRL